MVEQEPSVDRRFSRQTPSPVIIEDDTPEQVESRRSSLLQNKPGNADCIIDSNEKTNKGGLWIGNWRASKDVKWLLNNEITLVITIMPELYAQNDLLQVNKIRQEIFHCDDSKDFNISKYFSPSFLLIDKALQEGNVLIHCGAGISRSCSLTIAYLMKKNQKGYAEISKLVKSRRKCCNPNSGFVEQLKIWETKL